MLVHGLHPLVSRGGKRAQEGVPHSEVARLGGRPLPLEVLVEGRDIASAVAAPHGGLILHEHWFHKWPNDVGNRGAEVPPEAGGQLQGPPPGRGASTAGLGNPNEQVNAEPQDLIKVLPSVRNVECLSDQVCDEVGAPVVQLVRLSVAARGAATSGEDELEQTPKLWSRLLRQHHAPGAEVLTQQGVGGMRQVRYGSPDLASAVPEGFLHLAGRGARPAVVVDQLLLVLTLTVEQSPDKVVAGDAISPHARPSEPSRESSPGSSCLLLPPHTKPFSSRGRGEGVS